MSSYPGLRRPSRAGGLADFQAGRGGIPEPPMANPGSLPPWNAPPKPANDNWKAPAKPANDNQPGRPKGRAPRRAPFGAGWRLPGWYKPVQWGASAAADAWQWANSRFDMTGWEQIQNCGAGGSPLYAYSGTNCGLTFMEDGREGLSFTSLGFRYVSQQQQPRARDQLAGNYGWLAVRAATWRQALMSGVSPSQQFPPRSGYAYGPPGVDPAPVAPPRWYDPYAAPGAFQPVPVAPPVSPGVKRADSPAPEGSQVGNGDPRARPYRVRVPGLRYQPQIRPPNARPTEVYGPETTFHPNTGQRPSRAWGAHRVRRPHRNEREKKIGTNSHRLGAWLVLAVNAITETRDFLEALWDALPKEVRRRYDGRKSQEMALAIWENLDELDLSSAMLNLIANHVEDKIVGRLIASGQRQSIEYRFWSDWAAHLRSITFGGGTAQQMGAIP